MQPRLWPLPWHKCTHLNGVVITIIQTFAKVDAYHECVQICRPHQFHLPNLYTNVDNFHIQNNSTDVALQTHLYISTTWMVRNLSGCGLTIFIYNSNLMAI
jgi:hypothetical protein